MQRKLKGIFYRTFALGLVFWTLAPGLLRACPVCYGKVEGPTNAAINAAILLLIGLTGMVLSGIVLFFVRMNRFRRHKEALSQYMVTDEGEIVLNEASKSKALSG